MTMNKKISIMGCGWLGLPLAKKIILNDGKIKGSTTKKEKLSVLKAANIEGFVINIKEDKIEGDFAGLLFNSDLLIINIPPKFNNNQSYVLKLQQLLPIIDKANISKIIFVSSTAVYANQKELITEENNLFSENESALELIAAENLFKQLKNSKVIILRLAGLVGEDRQPVRYLVKKEDIPNPDHTVNLIHLDDCIKLIIKVIEKFEQIPNHQILIGVNQQNLKRQKYYNNKAIQLGLTLPKFNNTNAALDKKIDNPITRKILDFNAEQMI